MRTGIGAASRQDLPAGYALARTIDLKKDRRLAPAVQLVFGAFAALAVAIAVLLDLRSGSARPLVLVPLTVVACLLYLAAHELTHGVTLRVLTGVRPTYDVRLPFLTTSSEAYLARRAWLIVALTPVVLWGLLLTNLVMLMPVELRLGAFVVLALNFAGSAGDLVASAVVARHPADALLHDAGETVAVYTRTTVPDEA